MTAAGPLQDQGVLPGMPRRSRRTADAKADAAGQQAPTLPVARVLVDVPLAHLDHTFDYLVPAELAEAAVPGSRVTVRFGGRDVGGYLVDRVDQAEHAGRLSRLRRVVSAEPVAPPATLALARAVAERYAGTVMDVLRLAVPPRHARVEKEPWPAADGEDGPGLRPSASAWTAYRAGPALLRRLTAGDGPRAVWTALPGGQGTAWPDAVAQAVVATLLGGRGAVVVLPDARDVARVDAAMQRAGVPLWRPGGPRDSYVALRAEDGPAPRYRSFLAALRGRARVVIGTRAAAWAPVPDLGLVACWDDGDDTLADPRAPYPHAREVLALRAEQTGCAFLAGALTRSTELEQLVATGWAQPVQAERARIRTAVPRVRALTTAELAHEGAGAAARLPSTALRAAREALADGPVLVQVPRAGYLPVVACARCRAAARCARCHGPLSLPATGVAQCGQCGALAPDWRCGECGGRGLRSVRVGSSRTAEELGRAFPGVPVRLSGSGGAGVLSEVPAVPALVVATPGAEPWVADGYVLGMILDAAVLTGRTELRAAEHALRLWLNAAALVRSAADGGQVLVVGDGAVAVTQALVRWDPVGFAERELAERRELGLPPTARTATVTGDRAAVEMYLRRVELPEEAQVLGPVRVQEAGGPDAEGHPADTDQVRAVLRAPLRVGTALSAALRAANAGRAARRDPGTLRVQIDPKEML